jgi:hypothetical protein
MVGDIAQTCRTRRRGGLQDERVIANHLIFQGILKHFRSGRAGENVICNAIRVYLLPRFRHDLRMRKIRRYFADVVACTGALPITMTYRLFHASI